MSPSAAKPHAYAVGVDYGTNSVRALVVDVADGAKWRPHVFDYPSGEAGILLDPKDPNLARQNPADYIEGFSPLGGGGPAARPRSSRVFRRRTSSGIGVDTTGSTPHARRSARDAAGHACTDFSTTWRPMPGCGRTIRRIAEAAEITEKARRSGDGYLAKCGGTYSRSGSGRRSCTASGPAPKVFAAAVHVGRAGRLRPGLCHRQPRSGHNFPAGSAPPDTRPCTYDSGAGCPARSSCASSIRLWCRWPSATPSRPAG